tara:strand:+ start:7702 stop:8304 length:603 start_codon:yes stop_codon:yes gene_type:complete
MSKSVSNFQNEILKKGIIYKCYSKTDDKIYYGSTKNLPQRLKSHNSKKFNKTQSVYIVGNIEYEILEEHENIRRYDLECKERIYIENHKADLKNPVICINKNIPTQTDKEYSAKRYKENSEMLKEKQKEYYWNNHQKELDRLKLYYSKNKDKMSEKSKNTLAFCDICKCSIRADSLKRHNASQRHINKCKYIDYSGGKVI